MKADRLISVRRQAEKAVSEMPEGPMKVKAFEVILDRLLQEQGRGERPGRLRSTPPVANRQKAIGQTIGGRILVLRDGGFFREQRSIGEIQEALRARGWHYPLTTLSGRLQELVQRGILRRERVKDANKKIWKYSNL